MTYEQAQIVYGVTEFHIAILAIVLVISSIVLCLAVCVRGDAELKEEGKLYAEKICKRTIIISIVCFVIISILQYFHVVAHARMENHDKAEHQTIAIEGDEQ